ncbi:transglycosylase family protein [Staphylococcus saprophyticus]|uniref:transglycosylase family protein n=1 Tax=Staphylococcus saprophyticus TaxID=29385 RepID=UPI002DBD57ED|nr:transglycosylase family protein [Staphylococcus saprophyticus]MEB5700985.1 transglycosylase family protein [Staphylococcus saprophyticus]
MKKTILASSLAVALGVTGYAATADHNQAHASEENIDQAHLADLAQNNPEQLNEKPLHAGAYNYDFVLGGNEYTFTSDGQTWSWNYTTAGAQSASSNTIQDVTAQANTHTNETSANEVRTQQQSSNTEVAAVEAPKASSNTNVQTAQTSTSTKSTTTTTTTSTSSIDAIANQMAERTGVSASQWKGVIQRESGGNANAVNASSGAYGLFQLLGHGEHAGMSVQDQIDKAVEVYNNQGAGAWVAW